MIRAEPRLTGVVLPLAAALLLLAGSAAITNVWEAGAPGSDVALYARYGEAVAHGTMPFRDLRVEYPPGALAVIVPPAMITNDPLAFGDAFVVTTLLLVAAAVVVTWLMLVGLGHRGAGLLGRLVPLACGPALLGPVAVQRLDPLPALGVALALLAAMRHRFALAALITGAATATKIYPVVALPALLVRAARRGGRRAALIGGLSFGAGAALVVMPFVLAGGAGGLWYVVRYHLERPLQVEALGSSGALLLHVVAGFGVGLTTGYGSVNLGGARGEAIGACQALLLFAASAWIFVRTAAVARSASGLMLASATAVTAFVALGKVLSPQYLVWLLPLVPLVAGRTGRIATIVLSLACVLTRIWYEHFYVPVTRELDPAGIGVLVGRNAMLVLLLAILAAALGREARHSAGASLPGLSPRG